MSTSIEIFPDAHALAQSAGERLAELIRSAIATRGTASVVLTGGGNGIAILQALAADPNITWSSVQVFWGDERFVPSDDGDRNDKQARDALLDHVAIPATNIHPMPASDGAFGTDLDAAARHYEEVLRGCAEPGGAVPTFDVHLLGMGGEGHINSLFPHTPAVAEQTRMVVGVTDSPKPPPRRITLTLPAVRCARQVWLLVSGAAKSEAVAAALGGATAEEIPAAGAVGREQTIWFLDADAAAALQS